MVLQSHHKCRSNQRGTLAGLSLSWDTGLNPIVQRTLEGFACLAGAKGEAERAARLWGAAQTLHETEGIPRDTDFLAEADARISAVRSGISEEA